MLVDLHFIKRYLGSSCTNNKLFRSTVTTVVFCVGVFGLSSAVNAFSPTHALPEGRTMYTFAPEPEPTDNVKLGDGKPLGLGPAATGGSLFELTTAIPSFKAPVDVYLTVSSDIFAEENYFFTTDLSLVPLSSTRDIRFRKGTLGNTVDTVLKNIPVSTLPPAKYIFQLFITPAGSFDSYIGWETSLDLTQKQGEDLNNTETGGFPGIGGGAPGTVTGSLLTGLDRLSSANFTTAVNVLVSTIQEGSVDTAAATLASYFPDLVSETSDGFKVDWGPEQTLSSGTALSGSMTMALSRHQSRVSDKDTSRTLVSGRFRFEVVNTIVNGTRVPDGTVYAVLQADVVPGGIEGNILITDSTNRTRGGIAFNTLECSKFPVAGYLSMAGTIVNISPGCVGTYTAQGHDAPVLSRVSSSHILASSSWGDTTNVTLYGSNMWPPYDREKGDNYPYSCHIRERGQQTWDQYVTRWRPDAINLSFPAGFPTAGSHEIYLECPWSKAGYDQANALSLTVRYSGRNYQKPVLTEPSG